MTLGDVRLYLLDLEEALGAHMSRGETRYAKKEVRTVVEDLAFMSAHHDGRLVPSDLDYARALEAVKRPASAADAIARRRPIYRRRQLKATVRGWTVLLLLVLAGVAIANAVGSEVAVPLEQASFAIDAPLTGTVVYQSFNVTAETVRLDVNARATSIDADGRIDVKLLDPQGNVAWEQAFTKVNRNYAQANVEPVPGEWFLLVDYHDTPGSIHVEVQGVQPRV